ncbi:DUF6302 family protein [Streptomyces sp. NPDC088260]|uniref:DUF6302 family protein n=1 Tax=Streptomyces sp. NPDC088260 TaxID=3365850 RepID=UPI0037F508BD
MTTLTCLDTPPIALRPAREAYDYEYYRVRLADPGVLDAAVAIRAFRAPLLAVPVGGLRRGGFMSFDMLTLAVAARSLLDGQPGFPDLRVRWSSYSDTCHTVEWCAPSPEWWVDDATTGRFYGYSEAAISWHLRAHSP